MPINNSLVLSPPFQQYTDINPPKYWLQSIPNTERLAPKRAELYASTSNNTRDRYRVADYLTLTIYKISHSAPKHPSCLMKSMLPPFFTSPISPFHTSTTHKNSQHPNHQNRSGNFGIYSFNVRGLIHPTKPQTGIFGLGFGRII